MGFFATKLQEVDMRLTVRTMLTSFMVGVNLAKEGKLGNNIPDILDWCLSTRTPSWEKVGPYRYIYTSGEELLIEPNDTFITFTTNVICIEKGGWGALASIDYTPEKLNKLVSDTIG